MATIKEIIAELQWLSERISTQVRTLGIGLLVITWGLIISQPQIPSPISGNLKRNLLIVGVLALGSLVCDFLQYFFAYINTNSLRNKMEGEQLNEAKYNYTSSTYKLHNFFFWAKQITLLIACIWFLAVIIPFCIKAVVTGGG